MKAIGKLDLRGINGAVEFRSAKVGSHVWKSFDANNRFSGRKGSIASVHSSLVNDNAIFVLSLIIVLVVENAFVEKLK